MLFFNTQWVIRDIGSVPNTAPLDFHKPETSCLEYLGEGLGLVLIFS